MTELSEEYRSRLTEALREAYTTCPHAHMLLVCEQTAAPDDSVAGSVAAWQVGRMSGKARELKTLVAADIIDMTSPTLGIGVPADLWDLVFEPDSAAGREVIALAAAVKQEILSKAAISPSDEAQFRAAARTALERTRGDQVFMMAPSDARTARFFTVQELIAGEYGIVVPSEWVCVDALLSRAEEILLEESSVAPPPGTARVLN